MIPLHSPVDGTAYSVHRTLAQPPPSPPSIHRLPARPAFSPASSSTSTQARLAEETRAADGRVPTTLAITSDSEPMPPIAMFCRRIFPALGGSVLEDVSLVRDGIRVRTRFPFHTTRAIKQEFPACTVQILPPPSRPREVTFRRVPVDVTVKELERELKLLIGLDFLSVRRLHASTEGRPDPQRPLPVIVVRVNECAVPTLKSWRLFQVLNITPGADREVVSPTQCNRCWAWGHRAGGCSARRRCPRCGSHAHDISQCPRDKDSPFCFACKGAHSVRWGGCPERKKEDERVRAVLNETSAGVFPSDRRPGPVPDAANKSAVRAGVSYASRVSRTPLVSQAGRFDILEDEGMVVDLDQPPAEQPTPREAAAESRLRRKREIAYALREKRSTLTRAEEDLYKIELARAEKPSQALAKRHRALNAKLGTLRLKIRELEAERRGLSSTLDPPSRPASPPSSPGIRVRADPVLQSVGEPAPNRPSTSPGPSGLLTVLTQLFRSLWCQVRGLLLGVPLLGSLVPWIDVQLGFAAGELQ